MGAARCSRCDINYPYDKKLCPICEEGTWRVDDDYDADWSRQVERAQAEARFAPGERRPALDLPMVSLTDGRVFVATILLEREGVPMEPGQIILNRGNYYELVSAHFIDDEQTKGGWLIEQVPVEGAFGEGHAFVPVEWAP